MIEECDRAGIYYGAGDEFDTACEIESEHCANKIFEYINKSKVDARINLNLDNANCIKSLDIKG